MPESFRIVLISPYTNLYAVGLRHISASLKADGWPVTMLFLPDPDELIYRPRPHIQGYPPDLVAQVLAQCKGAGLVGMTVMTNSVERAAQLTAAVQRSLELPVLWGGIHATVRPEQSLTWADYVCVGEGEEAAVALVRALAAGEDPTHIPNIWTKVNGAVQHTAARPLTRALDDLPLPDYDLSTQLVWHRGRLRPLTPALLSLYLINNYGRGARATFMTYSTRGCPYRCTFCGDGALASMYDSWRRLRRRSPEHIALEINQARQLMPDLAGVMFMDSTFLTAPLDEIRRFSEVYRREVGLPFFIMATPGSINEQKLQPLLAAGLDQVEMGIQSGSQRVRRRFQRFESNERIVAAATVLHRHRSRLGRPIYDLITDNPYETRADQLETLRLLQQLPQPYTLNMFSLNYFPGTELYRQAQRDGLLGPDETAVFRKNLVQLQHTPYNWLLWAHHRGLPRPLLRFLTRPLVFARLQQGWGRPLRLLHRLIVGWRSRSAGRRYRARLAQL